MSSSHQKFAKKSLGQNFLNSSEIRDKILLEAGDLTSKNILEIGPGLGFLTTKLLKSGANVLAVELDDRAVNMLEKDFGHKKNFRLIHDDILKIDLDALFKDPSKFLLSNTKDNLAETETFVSEPTTPTTYSIIANIPYNITNPILRKILEKTENKPKFAILMIQKEVGEKIYRPKKKSLLSISVEIFAEPKICFLVGKENFEPIPKVDSVIIRLDVRQNPMVPKKEQKDFFTVVAGGFSQKRKKLGNTIGGYFGVESKKLLGEIDPNRRAETLSIAEWMEITKNFQKFAKQK